ncbi:RlpA-like protein [Habropoda laboriosa]|uniref:RlpA-like protein n=1 Tax=Habropoda laboriosa TaxID=597456 RepID=A0A0L7QIS3_9HYME|nr:RlpA-like protein [Habropoda laboriosa]
MTNKTQANEQVTIDVLDINHAVAEVLDLAGNENTQFTEAHFTLSTVEVGDVKREFVGSIVADQVTDLLESIPVENANLKTFHIGMSAQYANGRVIEMAATIDNSGAETGMSTKPFTYPKVNAKREKRNIAKVKSKLNEHSKSHRNKERILVNPVNTKGVMGAGLALEFKRKFPENFLAYQKHCKERDTVRSYRYFQFEEKGKMIFNLATKEDYQKPSKLGYVRWGLSYLKLFLNDYPYRERIQRIALPALGAGLGGLRQIEVLHQIYYQLRNLEWDVTIELYGFDRILKPMQEHFQRYVPFEVPKRVTGVGSRKIKPEGRELIDVVKYRLILSEYILASGDAIGADEQWWENYPHAIRERFGAIGCKYPKPDTIFVSDTEAQYADAKRIASKACISWRFLRQNYHRALHTRNVFQVLGYGLDTPSEFLVCWTPDGAEAETSKKTGGTGTAIRVANTYGIPVFNLFNEDCLERLNDYLGATLGHGSMLNQSGTASWYGEYHQGKLTADGERFNMRRLTAAHRSYPFGTILRVTNTKCGKSVLVKVNDRGPYHGNRILDMTKEAARRIDMLKMGTSHVKIHVVSYPKHKEPYHHKTAKMSIEIRSWVAPQSKNDDGFYLWLYRTSFDRTLNTDAKARFMFHQSVVNFLDDKEIIDMARVDDGHPRYDGLDSSIFKTDCVHFQSLLDLKEEIFEVIKDLPNITVTVSPSQVEVSTRFVIRHISAITDFINEELAEKYKKHQINLYYDGTSGEWVLSLGKSSLRKINIHLPSGYDLTVAVKEDGLVRKMTLFKDGWSIKNVKNIYHLFDIMLDDNDFMLKEKHMGYSSKKHKRNRSDFQRLGGSGIKHPSPLFKDIESSRHFRDYDMSEFSKSLDRMMVSLLSNIRSGATAMIETIAAERQRGMEIQVETCNQLEGGFPDTPKKDKDDIVKLFIPTPQLKE